MSRDLGAAPDQRGLRGSFPSSLARALHRLGSVPRSVGGSKGMAVSITYTSHLGSAGWLKFGQRLGALGKFPGTLGAAGVRGPGTRRQDRLTLSPSAGGWLFPRQRALAR